mmetsp:Transcript_21400/g.52874  ORF Transcript_21400/g.52874 Transcript_21400/m.52874 type:complete len:244 (+) Transcript_21400:1787-2518(+)
MRSPPLPSCGPPSLSTVRRCLMTCCCTSQALLRVRQLTLGKRRRPWLIYWWPRYLPGPVMEGSRGHPHGTLRCPAQQNSSWGCSRAGILLLPPRPAMCRHGPAWRTKVLVTVTTPQLPTSLRRPRLSLRRESDRRRCGSAAVELPPRMAVGVREGLLWVDPPAQASSPARECEEPARRPRTLRPPQLPASTPAALTLPSLPLPAWTTVMSSRRPFKPRCLLNDNRSNRSDNSWSVKRSWRSSS